MERILPSKVSKISSFVFTTFVQQILTFISTEHNGWRYGRTDEPKKDFIRVDRADLLQSWRRPGFPPRDQTFGRSRRRADRRPLRTLNSRSEAASHSRLSGIGRWWSFNVVKGVKLIWQY